MKPKGKKIIVAIDGPAGAGKSTVAKAVARKLGILYIDTGAMYRALTLKASQDKIDLKNETALSREARNLKIRFEEKGDKQQVFLDDKNVSVKIRTASLTKKINPIAQMKKVREELVKLQRNMAKDTGAVMEGRDIGTIVFPKADFKFYLDAHFEERIKRRHKDLAPADKKIPIEDIRKDIMTRDAADRTRKIGPLRIADDALFIDTTLLSIKEVAGRIISEIEAK